MCLLYTNNKSRQYRQDNTNGVKNMKTSSFVAGTVDCVYPRPVKGDDLAKVCAALDNMENLITVELSLDNSFDSNGEYLVPLLSGFDLNNDYRAEGRLNKMYRDYNDRSKGFAYEGKMDITPRYLLQAEFWFNTTREPKSWGEALQAIIGRIKDHDGRGTLVVKARREIFKIAI